MMEPQPRPASLKRQFDEFDAPTEVALMERRSASRDPQYSTPQTTTATKMENTVRVSKERSVSEETDGDVEMDGEEEKRCDPAPILPGMTVANQTFPPSTSTNTEPPAKKPKTKLSVADKAEKAAALAQKASEQARVAAEKERLEREAAEEVAEKARTAVGDAALAKALAAKQVADSKAAKAKLASEQAAEKAAKEQQVARDLAQQVADKLVKDQEKAAEKARKDAEKVIKDAEKLIRDQEKAKKTAEKLAKEEAKKAKTKGQMILSSFFNVAGGATDGKASKKTAGPSKLRTSMSPAPSMASNADQSGIDETERPANPHYKLVFSDFFLKEETILAPITRFERDEDTSRIVNTTIDSYLSGDRSPGRERDYDAVSLFHLARKPKRGRQFAAVKDLVAEIIGKSSHPIDLTLDDQNAGILRSRDVLKRIPLKIIHFKEDVRPPYRGTYTRQPVNGVKALARNPFRKDLPDQNYDHDSEAEWFEGDDDEEDLGSEDDPDEEDDDEDMEDFLDDEGDETAQAKRLHLQGDLEPVSTGLCWEDKQKRNTNVKMMPYRMEVIIDPKLKSIDPFSTEYWEPSPKTKWMPPPSRSPLNNMNLPNAKVTKSASVKSFFAPASASESTLPTSSKPVKNPVKPHKSKTACSDTAKVFVPDEDMPDFRAIVQGSHLSKVGLIETLKARFLDATHVVVTDTLMHIAHKTGGKKRGEQTWVLNETDDA